MSFTITYIQDPLFVVDYNKFACHEIKQDPLSSSERIQKTVFLPFLIIKNLFKSVFEASYITLSNAGISFKHIVLRYYGSWFQINFTNDIYLTAFKVVFWVVGMGLCVFMTSCRLFLCKMGFNKNDLDYLSAFAGTEIDLKHIRTDEIGLDARHVPEAVEIDNLFTIYDDINFIDNNTVGYMADTTRQEDKTIYSVEDLRESLGVFISNVKNRVAFLGTPPSYDTPRLMDFYQQIEDAVRLSIHESNERIREFKKANGENASDYNKETKQQYHNLLEDRARIAIDLAIAGKHCGARHMGEAMSVYYSFNSGNTNGTLTFDQQLIQLLAFKRKKICDQQIQQHLGANTHAYNNYMGNMGKILGIPGTLNIIETLSTDLDRNHYLELFFKEYTVNYIIDAIQQEIKKSQPFREKIMDWFKDQLENWDEEAYNIKGIELINKVTAIIKTELEESEKIKRIKKEMLLMYLFPLEDETIIRMLKGEVDSQSIIKNSLDRDRRNVFLEELKIESIAKDGLSKKLIEWIIVQNHILLPQL